MNALNILDSSSIVEKILSGHMLPEFEFEINKKIYNLCYYLDDGIYEKWAIFIDKTSEGINKKE